MVKEYIDRKTAINDVGEYSVFRQQLGGLMDVVDFLKSQPEADVAPVVHSRWEPRQDAPGFVRCSACRDCNVYDEWADGKKWSYCPECGAKMDLEVNDAI